MATKKAASKAASKKKPVTPFAYKLVLNQWLLSLFNAKRFEDLAEPLRNEALEGLDENNVHRFHHALTAQLFNLTQLPTELLLEYDQNVVKHTQRLNERRITRGDEPVVCCLGQLMRLRHDDRIDARRRNGMRRRQRALVVYRPSNSSRHRR